jgi:hypothetical protein
MLPRERKYIRDWEQKQSKGKWRYLFLSTAVWGSIIPVVIEAFKLAAKGALSWKNINARIFVMDFLYIWLGYCIACFCLAWIMWHLAQRKYLEFKRKQK